MGAGNVHQWVAGVAAFSIVIIILVVAGHETKRMREEKRKPNIDRNGVAKTEAVEAPDGKKGDLKPSMVETDDESSLHALAHASKALIPPPGEKRIQAVSPRNAGRFR